MCNGIATYDSHQTTCFSRSHFQQQLAFTMHIFCIGVSDHLPKVTSDQINCSLLQIVYGALVHRLTTTLCVYVQIVYDALVHRLTTTLCVYVQMVYDALVHRLTTILCVYVQIVHGAVCTQTHCYTVCICTDCVQYSMYTDSLLHCAYMYRLCMVR